MRCASHNGRPAKTSHKQFSGVASNNSLLPEAGLPGSNLPYLTQLLSVECSLSDFDTEMTRKLDDLHFKTKGHGQEEELCVSDSSSDC